MCYVELKNDLELQTVVNLKKLILQYNKYIMLVRSNCTFWSCDE